MLVDQLLYVVHRNRIVTNGNTFASALQELADALSFRTMEKNFGDRLYAILRERGMSTTQKDVGKLCGVSGPQAYKYKTGQKLPTTERVTEIALRLGVTADWLLTGRGPKYPGGGSALRGVDKLSDRNLQALQLMLDALLATQSDETDTTPAEIEPKRTRL